jgi:hypothetical protein
MLELSYPSDILNAFAGISTAIQKYIGGELIAGCPSRYLDLVMLWNSTEPAVRRTPIGHGGSQFPSWAWAGWTGSVQYLLGETGKNTYRELEMNYAQSEVASFTVHHHCTILKVFKSNSDMNRVRIRNLGSQAIPLEHKFPEYVPYSNSTLTGFSGPQFGPNVLQFWTEAVSATSYRFSHDETALKDPRNAYAAGKKAVTPLLDEKGRRCGLLIKPSQRPGARTRQPDTEYEFILISSYGESKDRMMGFETFDSTLRLYDEKSFAWKGEGSGLVNLILVEWHDEVAERLSIAQVHRQAWLGAKPFRKHVRLV